MEKKEVTVKCRCGHHIITKNVAKNQKIVTTTKCYGCKKDVKYEINHWQAFVTYK